MKRIKIIAGVTWAFLGLFLIIILFPGLNSLSGTVARLPFMKLNPIYTGGDVASQIRVESCTLNIRKPVFNGFLKERTSGFVQLDWHGIIPETIKDSIDYDRDGIKDFTILVDRKNAKTKVEPTNRKVSKVIISTPTSYGWAVRVRILK